MNLKQMQEKRNIEMQDQEIDMMWHQVLVADVREKEHKARIEENRRQQEMLERRRAYDEQIASANMKRQETIREERERENRRLERMKLKMEKDHYDAIKRKKDQQKTNKLNYIEGHQMKQLRLRAEKQRARDIDNGTISRALEDLQRERERNIVQMRNLQLQKQIFVENYNRERRIAHELEREAEEIAQEWKRAEEKKADEQYRKREREKRVTKEQAAKEYRDYLNNIALEMERAKRERRVKMERVKRAAYDELQKRLDSAKDELRKQLEYRSSLTCQIRDNQRIIESDTVNTEIKDKPFTKKAMMFQDAVDYTLNQRNVVRESTNPVHPFMKKINTDRNRTQLPLI